MLNEIHRLREVVSGELDVDMEGDVPTVDPVEYRGLLVTPQGNGKYHATPEGFVDSVLEFDSSEYDDVLSLVDDLNRAAEMVEPLSFDDMVEEYGAIVSTGPEPEEVELVRDPEEYREKRGRA